MFQNVSLIFGHFVVVNLGRSESEREKVKPVDEGQLFIDHTRQNF